MHPAQLCGRFWTIFFLLSVQVALKKKKKKKKKKTVACHIITLTCMTLTAFETQSGEELYKIFTDFCMSILMTYGVIIVHILYNAG